MHANHICDPYLAIEPPKSRLEHKIGREERIRRHNQASGFNCAHCHQYVSTDPSLSGVQNRNHCPYCLWSRHMDLYKPGDRLSACKAGMKPIGLSLKKSHNKYSLEQGGEIMLIHICMECQKITINRIAADDDAFVIIDTYRDSLMLANNLKTRINQDGIRVLQDAEEKIVHLRLFGKSINGCPANWADEMGGQNSLSGENR